MKLVTLAVAAMCAAVTAGAADTNAAKFAMGDATKVVDTNYVRRTDAAMQKWRDNRFGQFIHWGIYSVTGGEWKGQSIDYAAEWIKVSGHISNSDYAMLAAQFNPTNFDAKAWARRAKQSGAKYVVITTKHHDGFCMWDSKYTDYDMGSTPYGKGVLKDLADAVRAEGMDMGFYYSIIDWNHPDYIAGELKTPEQRAKFRHYLDYMKDQLRELLTDFGDIKVLWFDGRWDPSYKKNPQYGQEIEAYCRSLKPGIVINDRVRAYDALADYNSGFERRLPTTVPPTDWEACMTMPEKTWGYHKNPKGGFKSPATILEMLIHCAGMGGNFLLNIGPRPDGSIRSEEIDRLEAVGAWMKENGDAIYGTDGVNLKLPKGIYATRKGDVLNVFVCVSPADNTVKLAALAVKPLSAKLAGGTAELKETTGEWSVTVPTVTTNDLPRLIRIQCDAPVAVR